MTTSDKPGALSGIRVLDLSRILAGPWAAQTLGDLGAEVIKVEQPGGGDGIRQWGPPFLSDGSGDSAYYLCTNRNKQSVAIDISRPEGAALVRQIAAKCDVVIENFRVGGLARYGLDYESLAAENPALIYCSVTGFGQDGPYKDRGGYDFLIQGMSGLMSVTGRPDGVPGGGPMKVGLPVSDLFTGLYATIAILAALQHRTVTGEGQHIDCALLDSQLAVLVHQGSNYLNGGVTPQRMANEHASVLPYQDFACSDATILVALGNDRQFRRFCALLGDAALGEDARFATNATRFVHRADMQAALQKLIGAWQSDELLAAMQAAGLPGGRVNEIPEILADPHVVSREIVQSLHRQDGTEVRVLGFPAKLSASPASCRTAPPLVGEHSRDILASLLGIDEAAIGELARTDIIQGSQLT